MTLIVYLAKRCIFNCVYIYISICNHSISTLSHSSMCFSHGKNELGYLNLLYYNIRLIIQAETTAIITFNLTLSIAFLNCNPVTLRQYRKLYITCNQNQLDECNIHVSYLVYLITFTHFYNSTNHISFILGY